MAAAPVNYPAHPAQPAYGGVPQQGIIPTFDPPSPSGPPSSPVDSIHSAAGFPDTPEDIVTKTQRAFHDSTHALFGSMDFSVGRVKIEGEGDRWLNMVSRGKGVATSRINQSRGLSLSLKRVIATSWRDEQKSRPPPAGDTVHNAAGREGCEGANNPGESAKGALEGGAFCPKLYGVFSAPRGVMEILLERADPTDPSRHRIRQNAQHLHGSESKRADPSLKTWVSLESPPPTCPPFSQCLRDDNPGPDAMLLPGE